MCFLSKKNKEKPRISLQSLGKHITSAQNRSQVHGLDWFHQIAMPHSLIHLKLQTIPNWIEISMCGLWRQLNQAVFGFFVWADAVKIFLNSLTHTGHPWRRIMASLSLEPWSCLQIISNSNCQLNLLPNGRRRSDAENACVSHGFKFIKAEFYEMFAPHGAINLYNARINFTARQRTPQERAARRFVWNSLQPRLNS